MRKVTQKTVAAFINGEKCSSGNTVSTGDCLRLHGNLIAKREGGATWINNCGWLTNTTKARLNGLLDSIGCGNIRQVKGKWYFNGAAMPSNKWIKVK